MKLLKIMLCVVLACATNAMSAEETGGFWGWLTGVTSSAWEGTKNTVRSVFGYKDEQKESYKKEEIKEKNPGEKKEEVVVKEKTTTSR